MSDFGTLRRTAVTPREPRSGLLKSLYTQNPFYLLSVCFVLHGTAYAFQNGSGSHDPWPLMGLILGYILLMATTAFVIVRFGKVWDDARSIFLILIALFVELSLTIDDLLIVGRTTGRALLLVTFLIAVLVTEGLLIGLRIRLRALYRLPLHLMLALLFLYPLVVTTAGFPHDDVAISWKIFFFFPCAGLTILALIPAIRLGPAYVAQNGTPWSWPCFPCVLFGFLATALCVRGYAISLSFDPLSFDPNKLEAAFGSYFLVPVVLALGILALEFSRVLDNRFAQRIVLAIPIVCIVLSFPIQVRGEAYAEFLSIFIQELGSPVLLTAAGASLFYAYAAMRKVKSAETAFVLALLFASVVDRGTVDFDTLVSPQPFHVWLIAAFEFLRGIGERDSRRTLLGTVCAVAALRMGPWSEWSEFLRIVVPLHLIVGVILVVSVVFRDEFARFLKLVGAVLLIGLYVAAIVLTLVQPAHFANWWVASYVLTVIVVPFAYAYTFGSLLFFCAGLINAIAALGGLIGHFFLYVNRTPGGYGFGSIAIGLLWFLLAAGISAYKAGFTKRLIASVPLPQRGARSA